MNSSKKPWITLVHGFSHDHEYFHYVIPQLETRYRVLAVDLPGHGKNHALPGPYTWQGYASHILREWENRGITETWYWGTHTGAGLGLYLASNGMGRIQGLVLEAPSSPQVPMPRTAEILSQCRQIARSQGPDAARNHWWESAEWFAVLREEGDSPGARFLKRLSDRFMARPWLEDYPTGEAPEVDASKIASPCLVYNGDRDLQEFLEVSKALAKELPYAEVKRLPGRGGFPLAENPSSVWQMVENWLKENAPVQKDN